MKGKNRGSDDFCGSPSFPVMEGAAGSPCFPEFMGKGGMGVGKSVGFACMLPRKGAEDAE